MEVAPAEVEVLDVSEPPDGLDVFDAPAWPDTEPVDSALELDGNGLTDAEETSEDIGRPVVTTRLDEVDTYDVLDHVTGATTSEDVDSPEAMGELDETSALRVVIELAAVGLVGSLGKEVTDTAVVPEIEEMGFPERTDELD